MEQSPWAEAQARGVLEQEGASSIKGLTVMKEAASQPSVARPTRPSRLGWKLLAGGAAVALALFFGLLFLLPDHREDPIPAHWLLPPGTNAWDAGNAARDAGEIHKAIAYWRQVPEGDRQYARARRHIGWRLYTRELGEPRKALKYIHQSLMVDPLDGNAWQDLGRTYSAALGLD